MRIMGAQTWKGAMALGSGRSRSEGAVQSSARRAGSGIRNLAAQTMGLRGARANAGAGLLPGRAEPAGRRTAAEHSHTTPWRVAKPAELIPTLDG